MWPEDLIIVATFINCNECLNKVYAAAAGPSHDAQASDQHNVAGRDAI